MPSREPTRSRARSARPAPAAAGVPRPGQIYDPVARSLDVIGDRWSLVLVRHLLLGPKGFQELRNRTGMAPRVLSSRLRKMSSEGFVESVEEGGRPVYALTAHGRSLEPVVASIARWFTRHGASVLSVRPAQFTETSAQSILEALPFLLREDRAEGARITFEIRLTGDGGGVWTIEIADGACHVRPGFAERADVRYTADARMWCAMALGIGSARDLVKRGLVTKDGAAVAMDHYFHQIARPEALAPAAASKSPTRARRTGESR